MQSHRPPIHIIIIEGFVMGVETPPTRLRNRSGNHLPRQPRVGDKSTNTAASHFSAESRREPGSIPPPRGKPVGSPNENRRGPVGPRPRSMVSEAGARGVSLRVTVRLGASKVEKNARGAWAHRRAPASRRGPLRKPASARPVCVTGSRLLERHSLHASGDSGRLCELDAAPSSSSAFGTQSIQLWTESWLSPNTRANWTVT